MTTEPRVKEQLSLTTRNIERLQKLVDSLMDFTRVEGKVLTLVLAITRR